MNTATLRVASDLQPGTIEIEVPVLDALELARLTAQLEKQLITRLTFGKEN